MTRNTTMITAEAELTRLAERLLQVEAVAVDTEFFWERTFYPILGLVQLATGEDECWLVDTVRLPDLKALGPLLASRSVTKLLHDAGQDLWILGRATGATPCRIFDTRIAAGFAGFTCTCSLQALLQEVLGVELAKTETRSDWLRRPLSPQQLRYAADDVCHMLAVREKLLSRCQSDTVRRWLAEEQAQFDDPTSYGEKEPRQMYLRVKGNAGLDSRQLAILRELAAWREQEARRRDWPRGHLLTDDVLIALVRRTPAERHELMRIPGVPRDLPGTLATDILAALTRGQTVPENDCPPPAAPASRGMRGELMDQSDRLLAHIRQACAQVGIDPALVTSRAGAESYVQGLACGTVAEHPLSRGWRREVVAGLEI
jgi:ribonuclease D